MRRWTEEGMVEHFGSLIALVVFQAAITMTALVQSQGLQFYKCTDYETVEAAADTVTSVGAVNPWLVVNLLIAAGCTAAVWLLVKQWNREKLSRLGLPLLLILTIALAAQTISFAAGYCILHGEEMVGLWNRQSKAGIGVSLLLLALSGFGLFRYRERRVYELFPLIQVLAGGAMLAGACLQNFFFCRLHAAPSTLVQSGWHTETRSITTPLLIGMTLLIALELVAALLAYRYRLERVEQLTVPLALLLTVGILYQTFASASGRGLLRHLIFLLLGIGVMLVTMALGTRYADERTVAVLLWAWFGLEALNLVTGVVFQVNGSGSWLLGGSLQPGELTKLMIVVVTGMASHQISSNLKFRRMYFALLFASAAILVIVGDSGNAMIVGAVALYALTFYAWEYVVTAVVASGLLGLFALLLSAVVEVNALEHLKSRITIAFHALDSDVTDQLCRSLLSVMRGGLAGTGVPADGAYRFTLFNYAANTDLVFTGVIAVFGAMMGVVLLAAYCVMLRSCIRSERCYRSRTEYIIASTGGFFLAVQAFFHILGCLNIFPFSGVTLPFLSAGGSSICTNFALVGFLLTSYLPDGAAQRISRHLNALPKALAERLGQLGGVQRLEGYMQQARQWVEQKRNSEKERVE